MKKSIVMLAAVCLTATACFAQDAMPPKPPSVDDRLKHVGEMLEKEVKISGDQKQKVLAVYKSFFAETEKLRGENPPPPPPPPPPVNKEKMDKAVSDRDEKIKSLLTPEQFQTLQSIEKQRGPRHGGKPGKHGPPHPPPSSTTL